MTHNCSNCIHADVCKIREEYEEAVHVLENESAVFGDVTEVDIKCTHYVDNFLAGLWGLKSTPLPNVSVVNTKES